MAILIHAPFILLLIVGKSLQKATPESLGYKAAVVELKTVAYGNDSVRTLHENGEKFREFIEVAANRDVDIIVFPEFGLTSLNLPGREKWFDWATVVPEPSESKICGNSSTPVSKTLERIACAANKNSIYVVVNVIEKDECTQKTCNLFYGTNVVFDDTGKIVSRYRKFYYLKEHGLFDRPTKPELSTFTTKFGVTFGNAISYDVMYEKPLLKLIKEHGITDFVLPAAWKFEMAFLTTIQTQTGWAHAMNVNLLAAGLNRCAEGESGSGIYGGKLGTIRHTDPFGNDKLLFADLPKIKKRDADIISLDNEKEKVSSSKDDRDNWHPKRDPDPNLNLKYHKLDGFTTVKIDKNGPTEKMLEHKNIKCKFEVNVANLSSLITYRMIAFDGMYKLRGAYNIGITICAIIRCLNDSLSSCGHHVQNSHATTFKSILVTTIIDEEDGVLMMPNTLTTDLVPYNGWVFTNEDKQRKISVSNPTQNLITFGILGRKFKNDKSPSDVPTWSAVEIGIVVMVGIVLTILIILGVTAHRWKPWLTNWYYTSVSTEKI